MAFTFEIQHQFSEKEYVALSSQLARDRERRWPRLVGIPILGSVCLLSPYTAILGVVLILFGALALFAPKLFLLSASGLFHKFRYLHSPLTYGVSAERLSVKGWDFQAEAAWRHLVTWREQPGWLILTANGIPPVYLPFDQLKTAGVHEEVRRLARQHAAEPGIELDQLD